MTIPIVLITTPTADSFETVAYDSLKLHSTILKRIKTLTNTHSWDEVRIGDVKTDAKECRTRAESVAAARLLFDPRNGVPGQYWVEAVVVYPTLSSEPLPRVVLVHVAYGNNVPSKELYYADKLPLVVMQRLESLKSKKHPNELEENFLEVLYGDINEDFGKDCFVESDYLPGNEAAKAAKEARHAAREIPHAAREDLVEAAAVKEKVKWVKGSPQGFEVVMERAYCCG